MSCKELTHWKRPWCWEGLGAGGEGSDRGWDGSMVSPTRWTWVWVDSWSWWWIGRPGMLRFMGSQRVGHDWGLNWTEQNWTTYGLNLLCFQPLERKGTCFYCSNPERTHHSLVCVLLVRSGQVATPGCKGAGNLVPWTTLHYGQGAWIFGGLISVDNKVYLSSKYLLKA